MGITYEEFLKMTINDLERSKFCIDSEGNVAIRYFPGISARGPPVETWAELVAPGVVDGEARIVRNDPSLGSTIGIRNGTERIQIGASAFNRVGVDANDIPGYLGAKVTGGDGIAIAEGEIAPGNKKLVISIYSTELQSIIEALTTLDLSGVDITLGTINGDISFGVGTTIDWTNTANAGSQDFGNTYIANYDGSTINIINNAVLNLQESTFNIDNSVYNSENNIYNYEGDTINYNETTNVSYEGDIFIGGDIISMDSNVNTGGASAQTGAGVAFSNIANVLACDNVNVATATPIDPTGLDSVQLIVGGVLAGTVLSKGVTSGIPAVYGNGSELRGLTLTPAQVNASNFGVSFKFGDSKTIEVTDFGFAIAGTDDILGARVEVVFSSTPTSVSVDCITMVVYSTAGVSAYSAKPSQLVASNSPIDEYVPKKKAGVDQFERVPMTGGTELPSNYLLLTDTLTGTTPLDIVDTRILVDTPYLLFYETQPAGNITRTLTNGQLAIVSDNAGDTMDVTVVFFGIGPGRQYMKADTSLTGTGPWVINDYRVTGTTPVAIMPRTTPVGYLTAVTGAGTITISSTGTEAGVIADYIVFLDSTSLVDGMPQSATIQSGDLLIMKDFVTGEDKAVDIDDIKAYILTP